MNISRFELPISTREGEYIAHYSEKGLAELDFPNADGLLTPKSGRAVSARQVPLKVLQWHRLTTAALKKMLAGLKPGPLPPLDWSGKTDFQKNVWKAMLKISTGKTKSYGDIAMAIGNPKAVRAVGGACGANPIPVLVPCHRVLAANNKLGGFSSGLDRKRDLLAREGVAFDEN
ncbi:MAG TPA: MGMT family protein [Verrucomicrobiae bacterium]|jgi:O-6-methylguanine DNA methyltransferase